VADRTETKVQELSQETLPPTPENATTTDHPVADEDRQTIAAVLARQVREVIGDD
jgi:hypothetical protein